MNIYDIKEKLESSYHIGFDVSGDDNYFKIVLSDSRYDRFEVVGQIKDNIRLSIVAKPEKFAGNFLKLLNESDQHKRANFVSLWQNAPGEIKLTVDGILVSPISFMNNNSDWSSFEIRYTLLPFVDDSSLLEICETICGMFLSLIDYHVAGYEEGRKINVHMDKYERNPINRRICLSAKGYTCVICGFNFEEKYGNVGKSTIEVHHTVPVSEMGEGYVVKPIEELEPVCSNCHTIIHKKNPPYSVEEVKNFLNR